jgi:hypothetical protein
VSRVRKSSIPPVGSSTNGFQRVGDLVQNETPQLLISKCRQRQLERIELIRAEPDRRGERLGFTSRPFVLCGLPLRRPPKSQLMYERRNGKFTLHLVGHPEFGLPFGQDRLIPIFLATLAVRQRNPVLRFKSGAEMLEMFGMQRGGKEYRRLVAGIERIFGTTVYFRTEHSGSDAKLISRARFHFVSKTHIWFDRSSTDGPSLSHRENIIALSHEFFEEVTAHPIPSDLEVIRLLAASPGALDLYLWLAYRTFTAKGSQAIPLFGPHGLQAQLGCTEYSRPRRFRAMLAQWLSTMASVSPRQLGSVCVTSNHLELADPRENSCDVHADGLSRRRIVASDPNADHKSWSRSHARG